MSQWLLIQVEYNANSFYWFIRSSWFCPCVLNMSFLFLCFDIWGLTDIRETAPPRVISFTGVAPASTAFIYNQTTQESTASTAFFIGLWYSELVFPCPSYTRVRCQTRDSPCAPEPADMIHTNQYSTCLMEWVVENRKYLLSRTLMVKLRVCFA